MSDTTLPRPVQATLCGSAVLVGSVLVVLLAFSRMASLGTIEAQEEAQMFADSVGQGIGLTADGWQSVLRVLCLVAGGVCVVTAYLGWQVLQRDRSARLALSVLAPVVLIAGTAVADIVPAVMTVAIVMLWRQPNRDWFDGIAAARPAPRPDPVRQAPAASGTVPAPPGPGHPVHAGQHQARPVPSRRPGELVGAVVTTIVSSALVLVVLSIGLAFVLGNRGEFEQSVADEIAAQPAYQDLDVDPALVTDVAIGFIVVFLLWSLVAIALAALTANGSNAARIALVVSSIGAALASLLGALAVFPLVLTAACVVVSVLLLRRDSVAWFAARKGS